MGCPPFVAPYDAPLIEELLKSGVLIALIARGRIGFLVDAAVHGFAVGTGFALVENVIYLNAFGTAPWTLWLVRGLGTAMLHGGATAIFGILSRALSDRYPRRPIAVFVPGLLVAVAIHFGFNQLPLPPMILAAVIMLVLPLLLLFVFDRSERATREWMGAGMDLDIEVLQLVSSEHFTLTRFGQYLRELGARFPGIVVADMYCLLRLELELSVHARAMIMARDAGLESEGGRRSRSQPGRARIPAPLDWTRRLARASTAAGHQPSRQLASGIVETDSESTEVTKKIASSPPDLVCHSPPVELE